MGPRKRPLSSEKSSGTSSTKSKAKAHGTKLTEERKADLKDAFDLFDIDGSGEIDASELKMAMVTLGMSECKDTEIQFMIKGVDKNGNGKVDFDEFLIIMGAKMTEKDSVHDVMQAFDLFDDDHTGKITLRNLKRVAQELGEQMTDDELMNMIKEADTDNDGEVSRDDFLQIMQKAGL
eukprot:CFRG2076T1